MLEFWPHVPEARLREVLEFATDVRRARSGEMRDGLKDATQRLQLVHAMKPAEAMRALALLRSNPLAEWYVPIWPDATFSAAGVSAGATSLTVETDADYRAGGKAVIWKGETSYELVDVDTIGSGGSISLSSPVVGSYAGPVIIAPVGTFFAPGGASIPREFALERLTVEFLRTDPADLGASSFPTFSGALVLTDASVIVQPLESGVSQQLELIDSGFGSYALEATETYVRQRSSIAFADYSYASRWARRQLVHYLRGRDRPFWLPTYRSDFPLVTGFSSTLLRTEAEAAPATPGDLVGRAIQINTGAAFIHRTIAAATIVGDELQLTLNATPGVTVPADSVVSLMTLQRLDTDQIEISHEFIGSGFLSRIVASTIEVPA